MAHISDFIHAVKTIGPFGLIKRVIRETNEDNVFTNAAAMAYAWAFAVFPFMIFMLTLLPYLPANAQANTHYYVEQFLYKSGMTWSVANLILGPMDNLMKETRGGLLSVGLLLTLYAASGGMNTTMSALDEAFEVTQRRSFLVKRLVAIAMTVFFCAGVLVILIALPISGLALDWVLANVHKLDLPDGVLKFINAPMLLAIGVARYAIGLFAMQLLISVLYHFGTSKPHRLRFFSPGAIFATLGWIGTGVAMKYYFSHFANYSKTYGAVASMVIMLLLFYVDAIIVLIGAELDSEVERCRTNPDGTADCPERQYVEKVPRGRATESQRVV